MKIMIIDDEEDIGFILGFELKTLGHEVHTFLSALDAKNFFEAGNTVDAIVCDFQMPKMSGLEMYKWVKAHEFNGPFYILTGEPTMDQELILKEGIQDIFFKPDDLKRLISTLK